MIPNHEPARTKTSATAEPLRDDRADEVLFHRSTEPYRSELRVHGYRMLGSIQDAEDMVQETLLRAWKGFRRFQSRSSLRHWLYRIATNTCLNALSKRANRNRLLPQALGGPTQRLPEGRPSTELPWLEPYPDAALEGVADAALGPAARYDLRESVRLAFVAAIQHLPAKQRAVLLLSDVLGWSAAEAGKALQLSVPSVTSALQRARTTLAKRFPEGRPEELKADSDSSEDHLVQRYIDAWEEADLTALIRLLQDDAALAMPPWTQWYQGRDSIRNFFGWAFDWVWKNRTRTTFRVVRTAANRQVALGLYFRSRDETEYHAHTLQRPAFAAQKISGLTFFVGPNLFDAFGLPPTLPLRTETHSSR